MAAKITPLAKSSDISKEALAQEYKKRNMDYYSFSNAKGDHYALHSHSYNKLLILARGKMRWLIEGSEHEARAGDMIFLEKNTGHEVFCLEDTECMEGHY